MDGFRPDFQQAPCFFFALYAARVLGVERFGQYGFVMALYAVFAVIADCGLFLHQTRTFPLLKEKSKSSTFLSQNVLLRLLTGSLSVIIFIAIGFLSGKPADVKILVLLLAVALIANNIMGAFSSALYGYELFGLYGFISMTTQVFAIGLASAALYMGTGLVGIGVTQAFVAVMATIAVVIVVSKNIVRPFFKISVKGIKTVFIKAAPLGIMAIVMMIYYRENIVILSYIKDDIAVGYYNAAFQIAYALVFLGITFSTVLLPRISSLLAAKDDYLNTLYNNAFKYLLIAGIGVGFLVYNSSDYIIELVYSTVYLPASKAFSILIWLVCLAFVNSIQNTLLVAGNANRVLVIMTTVAAAINLVFSFILIPRFGIIGAAIAVLCGEFYIFVHGFIRNRRFLTTGGLLSYLWRPVFAAMAGSVVYVFISELPTVIALAAVFAIYILVLFVLGGLTKNDLNYFRNTLKI
ncbi:MAG: flippase [candidate division Zixibacteria bacterium]